MKILAIHNFHRKGSVSGDDNVFNSETKLLEENRNTVVRYCVCNDEFDHASILGKIVATLGMLWNFKHYRAIRQLIARENPDLVHVHTFFPLLSPSVLYAAKRCGKKVVATLHDTRFICPCATSLRNTTLCNACGDGRYFRMCKYSCFKGSKLQSALVASVFTYHRLCRSFYNQIDKYICLNDNQIQLLTDIGFDRTKIIKKYNFVPDIDSGINTFAQAEIPERYVVFYGRIGEEKGIGILMQIWEQIIDIPLVVMGGGPLSEMFALWAQTKSNVYYLGYTEHTQCLAIVKGAQFVVFPSIWYEGCSMVEIETQSLGKGLIATDLGFSEEAIENGVNGYKVRLGDADGFVSAIRSLWENEDLCNEFGRNARINYVNKYLPEDNYQQLMRIYQEVVGCK